MEIELSALGFSKGYIELVNEDPSAFHYINLRGVLKPESITTLLRIVYNCSCKTRAGVSLNDCLEEAVPEQNASSLLEILPLSHCIAF